MRSLKPSGWSADAGSFKWTSKEAVVARDASDWRTVEEVEDIAGDDYYIGVDPTPGGGIIWSDWSDTLEDTYAAVAPERPSLEESIAELAEMIENGALPSEHVQTLYDAMEKRWGLPPPRMP